MAKPAQTRRIDVVFSLLIFCAFAMAVLTTLMLGAGFYQRMNEMSQEGYDERIALSYVWTKIKNSDNIDMLYVHDFNGIPALSLYASFGDDTVYVTRIYPFNGWLYELFYEAELEMHPEDGTPIIRIGSLSFEQLEEGLIRVSTCSGSVLAYPRGVSGIVRGSFD
jgi:hypothetical protein